MDKHPPPNIIADISVLYELSLSVGQSLDLRENCERFLRTLMARKNLEYAAVWLRSHLISGPEPAEPVDIQNESLTLVYAKPQFRVRETEMPPANPLSALLKDTGCLSVSADDPRFKDVIQEKQISGGAYALFALGDIGILKLYSVTHEGSFHEEELNQLKNVISKFTVSLQGCLAHQELLWEIAERRETEEQLRQSEEKYRNVVERANDGIIIIRDGLLVYVNSRLARMADMAPDQLLGQPFSRFVHPAHVQKVVEAYRRRMAGEAVTSVYDTILVRPDGKMIHVELNAGAITYEGKPADLVFVRDVSERHKFEAERARLAMAVEQTADAVIITDTEGHIQYVNPAFERISGYAWSDVVGKNPRLLKSGKQTPAFYQELWGRIAKGDVWRGLF